MVPEGQLRRLKVTGLIALCVVALMVIAQMLLVLVRYQTLPHSGGRVSESGVRSALVNSVLYQAQLVAQSPDARLSLRDALGSLQTHQQRLADLSGEDLDTFNAFISAAARVQSNPRDSAARTHLSELGSTLYSTYNRLTSDYAERDTGQRSTFTDLTLTASGVILVTIVLLYFFVSRRRDKVMEDAMREVEERRQRFAAMFDNSLELMALYDPDGNIIRANPAAVARMGFGIDAIARHFDIHVAPRERATFAKHFAQALAGKASECSTIFLDADQNEVPVIVSVAPVMVGRRVVGVVGSARDMTEAHHAEEELIRSREQFRSLFEDSMRPIIAMSPEGILTHVNAAFLQMTGYRRDELVGESALMLVSPDRREMTLARLKGFEKTPHTAYEGLTLTKSGHEVPVEVEISPIRVHDHVEGYYVKYRDLTRERAIARAVSGKDERMRALYRVASSNESAAVQIAAALSLGARGLNMRYGFAGTVSEGHFEVAYRAGPEDELFPVGARARLTEAIGKRLRESPRALAFDDLESDPDFGELIERNLPWKSYIGTRIMLRDSFYGLLVFVDPTPRAAPFDNADLDFVDVVGTMITSALACDVHDRELQQQAFHDTLTGAVNRRLLEEHVLKAMARAHRLRGAFALHYIDLNDFKGINDRHGHEAGDEVLCEVVRRLIGAVRGHDVVARIGGDEFVVLETDTPQDGPGCAAAAQRLHGEFARPMLLKNGLRLDVRASMGTAIYPRDGSGLNDLLKHADRAMYEMKRQG